MLCYTTHSEIEQRRGCRYLWPTLFVGFALTLLLYPQAASAADTTYTPPLWLSLGREIKPFDEYLLTASSTRISRSRMGAGAAAQTLQADTVRSVLAGLCSVAAVTEDGQEAIKRVTIRNAQVRYKGIPQEIIPTGAVVEAHFSDAGLVYVSKGDTLSADVTADLSGLIRSEGGRKSGTIMDPQKPVSPGDVWMIDTAAFAATLGPPPSNAKRTVEGRVRFERIDTVGGIPVAVVIMDAHAENAFGEIDGARVDHTNVSAHVMLVVPLDKRLPAVKTASTTTISANAGEGGQIVHFDFEVTDEFEFRR